MKKIVLLAFAFGMICTVNAQETVENYDANEEMQEQMRLIINTLGLDTQEIYQLGQIMNSKKEKKDAVLVKIDALKAELNSLELNSEKEIRGILTDDQWAKYQNEIKPETEKVAKKHMETIDK